MKKLLLGTVALMALAAPASAADLAARPYAKAPPMIAAVYDWSGFYIGANGGWGSSRNCWDVTSALGVAVAGPDGCHDADGGTAGGQIGYRWQAGTWVFGLEAQGNWADFNGSQASLFFVAPLVNQTQVNALGLFTGQVGYAFNNALLYVKGGAAITDNDYEGSVLGVVVDRSSDTRWGAVVGAGLEFGFAPNWSAGVEYNHLFMGSQNQQFTSVFPVAGVNTRTEDIGQDVDMVTVRVNYRWGGPVIAKY